MLVISAVALLVLLVVGVDVAGGKGPAAPFRGLVTALALLLALIALALVAVVRVPSARAAVARAMARLRANRSGRLTGFARTTARELSGVRYLLVAYGMPTGTAVAVVLLYRIISFWIFVPVGWVIAGALLVLQRKDHAQVPSIRLRARKPEPSAA